MALTDTDMLLVSNGSTTETITFAQLKDQTVLNDSDKLLVNDGTKTETVTWGEMKSEIGPTEVAPVIGSVSLVESNPNADPRFTSQEFVATVSMTADGVPQSTKTIDAYVEGSITQDVQFDEPLESSGDAIIGGKAWQDDVSYNTSGSTTNSPAKMFDGNIEANSTNAFYFFGAGEIIWDTSNYPLSGSITVHTYGDQNTQYKVVITKGANLEEVEIPFTGTGIFVDLDCGNHSDVREILLYGPEKTVLIRGYSIDGKVVISDQDIDLGTELNFAAGTDMTSLAAGDTVEQTTATADTWSDNLSTPGSGNDGNNDRAFDGDETTFFRIGGTNAATYFQWLIGRNIKGSVFKVKVSAPANTSYQLFFMDSNNENGYGAPVTVDANGFIEYDTSLVDTTADVSGMRLQINESGKTNALHAVYINNQIVIDGQPIASASGTVGSVDNTAKTVTLSSSSGTWANGTNVTGPQKTITTDNTKKYLDFDQNGNVSDLLDAPQSPAYETTNTSPSLTFKFPATFPSGNAPDDELGDGTKLVVEATATNTAGSDGPKTAEVQPEGDSGPDVALGGLTTLYTGNDTTNKLTTGIDLVNNDGLVWIKGRSNSENHNLFDTVRGATNRLSSNLNIAQEPGWSPGLFESFDTDGFTLNGSSVQINRSGITYVAWTFEKSAGYFDVVQYTGNSTGFDGATNTISHSLGTKPGCIIVKQLDNTNFWNVYHTGVGNNKTMYLNENGAAGSANAWNNQDPTDSEFYVGTTTSVNGSGKPYIAYLFAEDTPDLIKCGSYTGTGNANGPTIDLGFEPQFVMVKNTSSSASWTIHDNKRGFSVGSGQELYPDLPNTEAETFVIEPTSTGFRLIASNSRYNGPGDNYIYVAIAAPTTRSLTQEEFSLQAAKFGTYNNRRDVHQGEQAMAQREALMKELQAAGVDPPAINKLLGGASS